MAAGFQYDRGALKFVVSGINCTVAPDRVPQGKFPYALNLRAIKQGTPIPRPGVTKYNAAALDETFIHTLRRLNNPLPGAAVPETLIVGAGTKLYTITAGTATTVDTGYSGYPLSNVPWRPSGSPEAWLYLTDGQKSRKIRTDGTNYGQGIAAPNSPPSATLGAPNLEIIEEFNAIGAWVAGGRGELLTVVSRVNTTIAEILYDSGTTGWACFVLTEELTAAGVGVGDLLDINSGGGTAETVVVEQVCNAASPTAPTITSITYDVGTTGLCAIQLSQPLPGIEPNAVVQLSGSGAEFVRVLEVDTSLDGTSSSFRCSTVSTHAVAETVTGYYSYRAYFLNTHAASEPVTGHMFVLKMVVPGTGWVQKAYTPALNILQVNGRNVNPDDIIHLALAIGASGPPPLTYFQSGTVQFDISDGTFTSDYLTYQFTPTSLEPNNTAGIYQFNQLEFSVASLVRTGTNPALSLANVVAIRISFTTVGPNGALLLPDMASLWVGGTYGPLVSDGDSDYNYVYTGLSSVTGAEGNPSPPMRVPLYAQNQNILVSMATLADPQVDTLNVYRLGGSLSTWQFVGAVPNTGSPVFNDTLSDELAEENETLVETNFVPWPIQDQPRTGTCKTIGTEVVWQSGSQFNTAWLAGTLIVINGLAYEFYNAPTSTTVLQLTDSAGFQSGVKFTIQEPTIGGIPLPAMWGPYLGVMFACGDTNNPGYLYWTQGNNPDAAGTDTWVEVTSPSEPLIGGCIFNGRPFVFSNKRRFLITPSLTPNPDGTTSFQAQDVPGSRGLLMRTGLAVGELIYFHGPDGIYKTDGQSGDVSLTDNDLRSLFPDEGVLGASVATIPPSTDIVPAPTYTQPLFDQLSWYDGFLYFDYEANEGIVTLTFDVHTGGWWLDRYPSGVTPRVHYGEEGESVIGLLLGGDNGYVYQAGGSEDDGVAIACVLDTPCDDRGDPRSRKVYADYGTRINPANATAGITVTPYFDDFKIASTPTTFGVGIAVNTYFTGDINAGTGQQAKNIAFRFAWSEEVAPTLYDYDYSWQGQPDDTFARAEYTTDLGSNLPKFVQGFILEANTGGVDKTLKIYGDGTLQQTVVVNHNGQLEMPYSWVPFVATELKVIGDTTINWNLFKTTFVYDLWPNLTTNWTTEPSDQGIPGYKISRYMYLAHVSTADLTLTITVDGMNFPYTVPNSGGVYKKTYIALEAIKGKLWSFSATCDTPFRLMQKDLEIWYKGLNGANYQPIRPFGGRSAEAGAAI